jgi:hypothetical protein
MAILVCFTAIWHIWYPFGTFCIRLVHFSGLGIMYQEKSGNPGNELATFTLLFRQIRLTGKLKNRKKQNYFLLFAVI